MNSIAEFIKNPKAFKTSGFAGELLTPIIEAFEFSGPLVGDAFINLIKEEKLRKNQAVSLKII